MGRHDGRGVQHGAGGLSKGDGTGRIRERECHGLFQMKWQCRMLVGEQLQAGAGAAMLRALPRFDMKNYFITEILFKYRTAE